MTWFKKGEEEKEGKEKREELKPSDQLWVKCNSCNEIIYRKVGGESIVSLTLGPSSNMMLASSLPIL
jgi:acetyl-CoA carboxylase beta subunit